MDTRLDLFVTIENTAVGASKSLSARYENPISVVNTIFTYSGVVEITSLSSDVGVLVKSTTNGLDTSISSGSMVWTRLSA
jgi:hypothetical protein